MITLEQAIQRCVDRINLSNDEESVDIYKYMFKYKVIRDLEAEEQDKVYDIISGMLGF